MSPRLRNQRGFSLIEVLIAAALFAFIAFGAFELVRQISMNASHLGARQNGYTAVERFAAQLRAESRSATSIVTTASGTGHDSCDEAAFADADSAGPHYWSYRRFPHHTAADAVTPDVVLRVAGTAPLAACDPAAAGTAMLTGIAAFTAASTSGAALASHTDAYLASADSPFVGASVAGSVPTGLVDATGAPLQGGNALIEIAVASANAARVIDLTAGTFPTGFTEQLAYTCGARCTVGHHADGAALTITTCALSGWTTPESSIAGYGNVADPSIPGDVDLQPNAWWISGTFVFRYTGTGPGGSTDEIDHAISVTNIGQASADGMHGTAAPFFAPPAISGSGTDDPANAQAWYARFAPYVASSGAYASSAALAAEVQRCSEVTASGTAGEYSYD